MSNSTVDSGYTSSPLGANGQGDGASIVQMSGIMQKKPFGHQSTKWSKRFFVLKEGFLLYYAESEKRAFETRKSFNIHPKGIVPLGYSTIEDISFPGMQFCINISHPDFKSPISVATEDEASRKAWMQAMDKATKVTLENSEIGETMIKSLQEQSLQLARERQEYVDKYINEAEELCAEKELREALEEFNQELEEENARIEDLVKELKSEHTEVKNQLLKAIESSKQLEKEREGMATKTEELHHNLELLSRERASIIAKLQEHETRAEIPAEQNALLARQLAEIEQKALDLEKDREEIRLRLEQNERESNNILREREMISQEAELLKSEMEELSVEKKLAEKELKEEMIARMELQKELQEYKAALQRLEAKALRNAENNSGSNSSRSSTSNDENDGDEQILKDVKSLREAFNRSTRVFPAVKLREELIGAKHDKPEFFENCARENMREPDKPVPAARRKPPATAENPATTNEHTISIISPGDSPVRRALRGSVMHRRRATARCKSMVLNPDTTNAAILKESPHRQSLLGMLARHKRSMSLSAGRGKSRDTLQV